MDVASDLCFKIARRMVVRRDRSVQRNAGSGRQVFDADAYRNWREEELRGQFMSYFSPEDVAGKDVVDLGCGEGDLSFVMCELGVKSITGIELSERRYRSSVRRAEEKSWTVAPHFVLARRTDAVELPAESVDVLLCFDVLEHIMDYESVVADWLRVLRPGGRVLIWWVPWWHPYGPHIESLVPIPWCHVLFSERTLLSTCARVYDMSEFRPRIWDLDENGNKKPNKWRRMIRLPEVNKLTMAEFERLCAQVGLRIRSKRQRGFGSSPLARLTRGFLRVPRLREYFTSSVVYELQKDLARV